MSGSFSPEDARQLERAWLRNTVDLEDPDIFDYAIRLATLRRLCADDGQWFEIAPTLDGYRAKLMRVMNAVAQTPWHYPHASSWNGIGTIAWQADWNPVDLRGARSCVAQLFREALDGIENAFPALPRPVLLKTLAHKKLALALGGGGGTGFAHLCLFQGLEERGLQPDLLVGTSIGALLGYARALQTHYDAARTTLKLPSVWGIAKNVMPCFGTGHHGLMGMCRIDISSLLLDIARSFGYTTAPSFRELKIPFACVASGVLRTHEIEQKLEMNRKSTVRAWWQLTKLTLHNTLTHAAQIGNLLIAEHVVRPVVLGFDDVTKPMLAADGVQFSMLVPGVLNFELPQHHYQSREILDRVFERDHLYRLADGGLASNVPVRAAEREILSGRLKSENVYLLGVDVFAPQKTDGLFYPLEQIANANALDDAQHADAFVRLQYLLSPMNLCPSLKQLHWLNVQFRKTFDAEMRILARAMKPLSLAGI